MQKDTISVVNLKNLSEDLTDDEIQNLSQKSMEAMWNSCIPFLEQTGSERDAFAVMVGASYVMFLRSLIDAATHGAPEEFIRTYTDRTWPDFLEHFKNILEKAN